MDALTQLYTADCRLVIERQAGSCCLRISRPGAALTGSGGTCYTLHIRAVSLEAALDEAVRWLREDGAGDAVEQRERHTEE